MLYLRSAGKPVHRTLLLYIYIAVRIKQSVKLKYQFEATL